MYKRVVIALSLSLGLLCGCSSTQTISDEKPEQKTVETAAAAKYLGMYQGVMPCASCDGIRVILQLNADTTYDLQTTYIGSADKSSIADMTFMESGVFEQKDEIITLITPSSGERAYFKLLDDGNILSVAEDGSEPSEQMRDLYILKKAQ